MSVSPTRLAAALCALAALTTGCGSSSSSDSKDASSKSPQQILADMRSALDDVRSYHLEGSFTDKDGETRVAGDVAAPESLRLSIRQGDGAVTMVIVGSETYLRANRAFWTNQGGVSQPKVVKLLADRWVKVPEGSAGDVRKLVTQFMPSNLAHCLSTDTGTVTKRGTATVDGQKAVVLIDKGDKPGTSPGELYASASSPTLPLRVRQTGPSRPGGHKDPRCGDSDSSTKAGDLRLSRFDEPTHIRPPAGALDLNRLGGASETA